MQVTPILQFGTSRFLQAHADLFFSEAAAAGQDVGPITVVQSSGDAKRAKRLKALVGSYPVKIEGILGGERIQETRQVTSVARTLSTATDWLELSRVFTQEVEIVLSNTGDTGFAESEWDASPDFDQRMSYPAKLALLLRYRFESGGAPIQIMPMELVVDNGDVLKRRVLELAEAGPAEFTDYLNQDVIWVNSLVDRIVSQPIEPAGAVAEPYALWAIEKQPNLKIPCNHSSIEVVDSLAEIETLKLFVLNLSHTFFANRWLEGGGSGDVFVRNIMEDSVEVSALKSVHVDEVRPAFHTAGLAEQFDAYVQVTFERFENPFLDHRIADIAQNHPQKVERRIGAMLEWARKIGDASQKPVLTAIVNQTMGAN